MHDSADDDNRGDYSVAMGFVHDNSGGQDGVAVASAADSAVADGGAAIVRDGGAAVVCDGGAAVVRAGAAPCVADLVLAVVGTPELQSTLIFLGVHHP